MRRLVSSGSPYETQIGYSRAVRDERHVLVSGTTGFDYATMTIAKDPAAQADQTLRNIEVALAEAGARIADVVRVRYLLTDPEDFRAAGRSCAAGSVRPGPRPRCSSPV